MKRFIEHNLFVVPPTVLCLSCNANVALRGGLIQQLKEHPLLTLVLVQKGISHKQSWHIIHLFSRQSKDLMSRMQIEG